MKYWLNQAHTLRKDYWFNWLDRRYPNGLRRYVIERKQLYILPTRSGLAFGLLLFVMLLGAINYSNSMGFFLTFLLCGIAHSAALYGHKNLKQISIQNIINPATSTLIKSVPKGYSASAFAAQNHELIYQLTAPTRRAAITASIEASEAQVAVNLHQSVVPAQQPVNTASEADQLTYQAQVQIPFIPPHRGTQVVARIRLETRYPLGLFKVWTWVPLAQKILVYPAPLTTPLPRQQQAADQSNSATRQTTGAEDFATIREYAPGDPLNHIAWKAFARLQAPIVKQFDNPASQDIWLCWTETTAPETEDKLAELCGWVLLANKQQQRFGLVLPDTQIEPDLSPQHLQRCLQALALYA